MRSGCRRGIGRSSFVRSLANITSDVVTWLRLLADMVTMLVELLASVGSPHASLRCSAGWLARWLKLNRGRKLRHLPSSNRSNRRIDRRAADARRPSLAHLSPLRDQRATDARPTRVRRAHDALPQQAVAGEAVVVDGEAAAETWAATRTRCWTSRGHRGRSRRTWGSPVLPSLPPLPALPGFAGFDGIASVASVARLSA